MNEKNGDVITHGAERPCLALEEWQAQIRMTTGLICRLTLCFSQGEPSIVDLADAQETLRLLTCLVNNLTGESARRTREAGGQS